MYRTVQRVDAESDGEDSEAAPAAPRVSFREARRRRQGNREVQLVEQAESDDEDSEAAPLSYRESQPRSVQRIENPGLQSDDEEGDSYVTQQQWYEQLSAEISLEKSKEKVVVEDLLNLAKIWEPKEQDLADTLSIHRAELQKLEQALIDAEERAARPAPPGPRCLSFLEGEIFGFIGLSVVVANVSTICLEATDASYFQTFFWLDQFYLPFYVTELVLKATYYQRGLLLGPICIVWWNWVDLIIVLVALSTKFILPLFLQANAHGTDHSNMIRWVRALRMFRLARLVKVVRIFVLSDLSWVDGTRFQTFMMATISSNVVVMGLEVDAENGTNLDIICKICEEVFLIIFAFEISVRLQRQRLSFFTDPRDAGWNILDFIIVGGGVLDSWLLPAIAIARSMLGLPVQEVGGSQAQVLNMLRMLRLLRLLRLVRLIRGIPQLYTLILGIAEAMQGMTWVMVLTTLLLYTCALFSVTVFGPDGLVWVNSEVPSEDQDDVEKAFSDLFGAIFILFKVMNADFDPMEGILAMFPIMQYVVMAYVVLTNWSIFSILTAVVSDHMTRVTAKNELQEEMAKKTQENMQMVDEIFRELDEDQHGIVSRKDLQALLDDEERVQRLCAPVSKRLNEEHEKERDEDASEEGEESPRPQVICPEDLREYSEAMNRRHFTMPSEEAQTITKEEFLKGLLQEDSKITERSVMGLEKRVAQVEDKLDHGFAKLEGLCTSLSTRGSPTSSRSEPSGSPHAAARRDPGTASGAGAAALVAHGGREVPGWLTQRGGQMPSSTAHGAVPLAGEAYRTPVMASVLLPPSESNPRVQQRVDFQVAVCFDAPKGY